MSTKTILNRLKPPYCWGVCTQKCPKKMSAMGLKLVPGMALKRVLQSSNIGVILIIIPDEKKKLKFLEQKLLERSFKSRVEQVPG